MVSPPCHPTPLYLLSDPDLGFTAHHPPSGLPQRQASLCSRRFPSNPRRRWSDGSVWVSHRIPGKRPARGLRVGKRARGPVPSPWSPCRRSREAGGPDGGNSTSHQLENPMPGFGLGRQAEPWRELLPPPPPSRGPCTPTPNSRRPAGFSLTLLATSCDSATAGAGTAGAGTATAAQPGHRPAPPHPWPCPWPRPRSVPLARVPTPNPLHAAVVSRLVLFFWVNFT